MTIFDEMVATLNPQSLSEKANAQHEVMQQIALSGLQRGGFFEHAAFYGGTSLRIFHNLHRFSEDMDFTLTEKNPHIHDRQGGNHQKEGEKDVWQGGVGFP